MMLVADGVWSRWLELGEQDNKPSIWLLVACSAPLTDVVVVQGAVRAGLAALEGVSESEFVAGYANAAAVPGGVAIEVGRGIENFERFVGLLVEELAGRGVSGTLGLFEPLEPDALPFKVGMVECRLRVCGHREHAGGPHYRWLPAPDSWRRLISVAVRWCTAGGAVGVSLGVSTMPRVGVGAGDDLEALLVSAVEQDELGVADCAAGGVGRWRMVAVEPLRKRVSLIEAGDEIRPDGWRQAVRDLRTFLEVNHTLLAYAFIKHGTAPYDAKSGSSLAEDWPHRPGFRALTRREPSFEDAYAPDAFAVQLLGPGYAGRVPHGPDWRETKLGPDHSLVEHIEPERWFDHEFVPFGGGYAQARDAEPPRGSHGSAG